MPTYRRLAPRPPKSPKGGTASCPVDGVTQDFTPIHHDLADAKFRSPVGSNSSVSVTPTYRHRSTSPPFRPDPTNSAQYSVMVHDDCNQDYLGTDLRQGLETGASSLAQMGNDLASHEGVGDLGRKQQSEIDPLDPQNSCQRQPTWCHHGTVPRSSSRCPTLLLSSPVSDTTCTRDPSVAQTAFQEHTAKTLRSMGYPEEDINKVNKSLSNQGCFSELRQRPQPRPSAHDGCLCTDLSDDDTG
jgi:hypothetical protein